MLGFEEALALLAVEEGASADEIRRAYLRRIRDHRPERDPEGFRRLREAYELLRFVGDAHLQPQAGGMEPGGVIPNREMESPTAPSAAPSADAPPTPFQAEPGPFRAAEPGAPPLAARLEALFQESDVGPALEQLEDLIHEARRQGWIPPVSVIMDMVLRGHAEGEVRAARQATATLLDVLGEADLEVVGESPGLVVRWLLVRELADLGDAFPLALRQALARAILWGDPDLASDELHAYVLASPRAGLKASKLLARNAPVLFEQFGDVLAGPRSETYSPAERVTWSTTVVVFLLVLFHLFRPSLEPKPPRWEDLSPEARQVLEEMRQQRGSLRLVDTPRARAMIAQHCRADGTGPGVEACAASQAVVTALEAGDCGEADRLRPTLDRTWEQRYGANPATRRWEPYATVVAAQENLCPAPVTTPGA